jgi:hypothetical protein
LFTGVGVLLALDGSTANPASLPVKVVDGSGAPGPADQVAPQLRALGSPISSSTTGTVNSTPAETVVYYAPGMNRARSATAPAPSAQRSAAGPGAVAAAHPAPVAAAAPSAAAIAGITEADPSYPSFDPTSCPAGATARALPSCRCRPRACCRAERRKPVAP